MTDNELNELIAKKMGWRRFNKNEDGIGYWRDAKETIATPKFTADLNAMHEVLLTLTDEEKWDYDFHILKITGDSRSKLFATARQQAEAVVRAWGFWKEGKK